MSEYLSEEEQIARMKSWWDENGTTVIVSVVAAVVGIIGWQLYGGYTEEQTFEASRAYALYTKAEADERSEAARTIVENFNGSSYHAFVLFRQAQEALAGGDPGTAERHLDEVIDRAKDVLLVDLAKIRLAKIQQAQDRSREALQTLESIRNEGYRAWGLEAKGDIHVSRGELELAHAAYTAAMDSLAEGEQRPILDMKIKNVAPFEDEYVQFADTLGAALQAAQESLDAQAAVPDDAEAEQQTTPEHYQTGEGSIVHE